jgi:hypothetical protein
MDAEGLGIFYRSHSDPLLSAGIEPTPDNFGIFSDAQYVHAQSVATALIDLISKTVVVADLRDNEAFRENLNFGLARRAKFIWIALRRILEISPPYRTEPMRHDDVEIIAADLNSIYINIRGSLDNMAWAILSLASPKESTSIQPQNIGLFNTRFQRLPAVARYASIIMSAAAWNTEMKERRDPAAHRIPLSVPPSIFSEADLTAHNSLMDAYNDKLQSVRLHGQDNDKKLAILDDAGDILDQMQRIGKYSPIFGHSMSAPHSPIYPTVPEDVGQFIFLVGSLLEAMQED